MRRAMTFLRWPLLIVGGLLCLSVLLLVGGYLYLQTDGGRDWLKARLVAALSVPGEMEISLGRLGGQIPQDIELEDLKVRDAKGAWLSLDSLRLAWRPLALLERRLVITDLEASLLTLDRLPSQAPSEEQSSSGSGLPTLPFAVRLERADIEDVRLGAPVLGQAVAFDLKGQAAGREDGSVKADFALERRDGVSGSAHLKARFLPDPARLALDATIDEAQGGLVALLIGHPDLPALTIALAGEGPIDDWPGSLEGDLEGEGALDAKIRVVQTEDLALTTQGKLTLSQRPEGPLGQVLDEGLTFDVTGRWDGTDVVTVDQAALTTAALELDLAGWVNLSSLDLDARASAKALDDRSVSALLDGVEVAGLALTVTAQGPALAPALEIDASASRLAQGDLQAEDLTLEATFKPDTPFDQGLPAGPLTANARAASLTFESSGEVAALIGRRFALSLEGLLDLEQSLAKATSLALEGEQIKADGSLEMNLADGSGTGDLSLNIASLSPLKRYIDMVSDGRANLDARVSLADYGEDLRIDLTGRLAELKIDEAIVAALLKGDQDFAAKLHVEPHQLSISDLTLKGPNADLAGTVALSDGFEQLATSYDLTLPDAAVLSAAIGVKIEGNAKVSGEADGPVTDPSISGTLALADAAIEGQSLGTVTVAFTGQDLTEAPNGHVDASAEPSFGAAKVAGDYRLEGQILQLTALVMESQSTRVTGQATVPTDGSPMTAELAAEAKSLAPWLQVAGLDGDAAANLQATLSPNGTRQAANLTGTITELTLNLEGAQIAAQSLDATLALQDLYAAAGRLEIDGTRLAYDAINLATARLQADGGLDAASFDLQAKGLSDLDPTLDAAGKIGRGEDGLTLELAHFTGSLSGQHLALRAPSTIVVAGDEMSVDRLDLDLGQASLSAAGKIDRESLTAKLELNDFPLGDLEPLVPDIPTGQVSAKLDVAGPLNALRGTIGLSGRTIKMLQTEDSQTLDFDLDGTLAGGTLDLTGRIDTGVGQDAAIAGRLPIAIDPESFSAELPTDKAVSAELTWAGDLAELWDVFGIAGHDLSGRGEIDVKLSGTLEDPAIQGQATIADGRFENFQHGTLFKSLEAELRFSGEEAVLSKLTATDGGSGRVSAKGSVELEPDKNFPLKLSATLTKATLVRRDDVTANADGDLTLDGTLQSATLSGKITTDRVEVSIAQSLPPEVVDLQVQMVNFPQSDTADDEQQQAAQPPFNLGLDLTVDMPRRVFVRGKGLDTEWSGSLKVTGTAAQPRVVGRMTLVRGTVDVVGKQFSFDHGEISFDGGAKIDPLIDIEATSQSNDIAVTVDVTGTATDPKIELTSVPEVPQDEMISQLLFGKSTNELSTFELVQVGAAVAQLTGATGGGVGILDKARNLLGVDVLRLDTTQGSDGDSNPALSIGKYVSDGVYLGVKQGAAQDSSSVTVDVDLTDNIAIESDVTETGDSNIGVRFQWDY